MTTILLDLFRYRKYNKDVEGQRHQRMVGYYVSYNISSALSDTHFNYTVEVYSPRDPLHNRETVFLGDPSWSEIVRNLEMLCNKVANNSFNYERKL
jgi:hypothetical protein